MAMATTNSLQCSKLIRNYNRVPASTASKLMSPHKTPLSSLHLLHKNASTLHLCSSQKLKSSSSKPISAIASQSVEGAIKKVCHAKCFVLDDNIDTDQIISAEYCTLVPSKPEEYEKLGSYAMIGLPAKYKKFIEKGQTKTQYPVVIAGVNFGCGSSREHAPVALGAAGVKVVVAESYARIFFRNSVSTGEVYPVETECRVCDECETGHIVTVELEGNKLINHTTGKEYALKPIGDAGPVIDAGGIFAYARKTGMIASSPSA